MDRIEGLDGDSPEAARRRLTRRLALAGVLIVILLGALAVFDQLSRMQAEDAEPARPAAPQAVGPSLRTDPAYPVGAPPPPPIQPSVAEAPAPEVKPEARVEPPPKPEVAAEPAVVPPPVAAAPVKAPPVRTAPARPVAVAPAAVPEGTSGGEMRPAPQAASAAPAAPPPAAAPARPLLPQLKRGYVLQAGVFTSSERAEELRAKLVMAGVPVTVESRVQVGPFATAQEAAAAREKIRALGVESLLIPPPRGRAAAR